VLLLLKSSDKVAEDLSRARLLAAGGGMAPCLMLRRYMELNPALEFRCFAFGCRLIAVSQRRSEPHRPVVAYRWGGGGEAIAIAEQMGRDVGDCGHDLPQLCRLQSCPGCDTHAAAGSATSSWRIRMCRRRSVGRRVHSLSSILPTSSPLTRWCGSLPASQPHRVLAGTFGPPQGATL
jgi:hypothetical protein